MCFSASASFTASALLSSIGLIALRQSKTRAERLFSAIPFMFAIHQFSEGLIWLSPETIIARYAGSFFLLIAFLWWPLWIPYSFLCYTQQTSNNQARLALSYMYMTDGFATAILLTYYWLTYGMIINASGCNIMYYAQKNPPYILVCICSILYLIATVLPQITAKPLSLRFSGWLIATAYVVSWWAYYNTLVSVWCFFAALISICILWFLHEEHGKK